MFREEPARRAAAAAADAGRLPAALLRQTVTSQRVDDDGWYNATAAVADRTELGRSRRRRLRPLPGRAKWFHCYLINCIILPPVL